MRRFYSILFLLVVCCSCFSQHITRTIDTNIRTLRVSYLSESIPFGEGTSVDILRARNLVIVRNTPENLKKVGAALDDIREAEPMVQVMFKFIEVNQDDLDELGFNWAYTRFNSDGSTKFSTNTNKLLRHYYTDRGRYEGGSQEFAGGGGADDRTLGINWGESKNALNHYKYN